MTLWFLILDQNTRKSSYVIKLLIGPLFSLFASKEPLLSPNLNTSFIK